MNKVMYKQVYDLCFRARNAKLQARVYVLDFVDWVKAGVAFNTRGYDLSTRKISSFARIYNLLVATEAEGSFVIAENRYLFEDALIYYYEDIYAIYQDHLRSKNSEAIQRMKNRPDFGDLIVLPSFDDVPFLYDVFERRKINCMEYECRNRSEFIETLDTAYLDSNTALFKCMSMMYDFGCRASERGILLEVDCGTGED